MKEKLKLSTILYLILVQNSDLMLLENSTLLDKYDLQLQP